MMSTMDINEIIGVEDGVAFKVYKGNDYLGMCQLDNGMMYSIYGFPLAQAMIEIKLNRADFNFVICPEE